MFLDALQQQIQIVDALTAADDFSVTLGGQQVGGQHHFRPARQRLHVKSLNRRGEMFYEDRAVMQVGQDCFIRGAEIIPPLDFMTLFLQVVNGLIIGHFRKGLVDDILQFGSVPFQKG